MPRDEASPGVPAPTKAQSMAIGFEWSSFSGMVRLLGAGALLSPDASFWSALVAEDRVPVRQALARAVSARAAVELPLRLRTARGVRRFVLLGKAVRSEPEASQRIVGVLVPGEGVWPQGASAVLLAWVMGEALDEMGNVLQVTAFCDRVLRCEAIDRKLSEPLLRSLGEVRGAVERLQASGASLLGLVQLDAVDSVHVTDVVALLHGLVARHPALARGREVGVRTAAGGACTAIVTSPAHLEYAVRLACGFVSDCVPPGTPPGEPLWVTVRPAPAGALEIAVEPPPYQEPAGARPRPHPSGAEVDLAVCRLIVERLGGAVSVGHEAGGTLGAVLALPAARAPGPQRRWDVSPA